MAKEDIKIFNANEYKVRCNLCNREMYINTYNSHYDKCLMITTLVPILKNKGEDVDYNSLDKYDSSTLEKVLYKYLPIKKDLSYVGRSNK